ncbi:MATE family efflux transporter [Pseudothermotoga sp. U03pept]|uniref:MATE family efflux transporter n=1 Tax=Pseudothermotoga sp. U03pept TaxID=3447012 RepID=UPI003EFF291B
MKWLSRDLTQGSLTKNLFYMALPTMGGFALQGLYDIVDMFWIGRISAKAIAGVTVFSTIFWLVEVLNEIIGMSSTSLISQNYGAKDYERTNRVIEQTIVFKIFVAAIASALMIVFLKPLMTVFSKDPEVVKAGVDYGYWRSFFMPIFFATYSTYTAQRMTGESRLPMVIMGTSAVLNVVLDPIFMFERVPLLKIKGLNMGVSGAAVATVVSTIVAFLWGFTVLLKGRGNIRITLAGLFKLNREIDLKLLTIGLPSGVEMLMRSASSAILTKVLSIYGSSTLAVIGVVSRLMGLAFIPLMGFSMGASAIVGQNLGAKKPERAEKTVLLAAIYGSLFVLVFVVLANLFPESVMSLFVHEKDVIREGVSAVRIGSWAMLIAALSVSLMSSFFGSGYTLPAMFSSIVGRWFTQLPYVLVVVVVFKLPSIYVWFSFIIAEVAEMIYALVVFSKGRWKEHRVK